MRKLLNTLFVTSEDIYLSLDGENVVANRDKTIVARYPLHTLSGILSFSYSGASPALMGACAARDIALSFCSPEENFWLGYVEKAMAMFCCAELNIGLRIIRNIAA